MLDNLGFGEFFFLALLALLFFGPERLPRIGAQIGRWVRSLTQYSSAFLTEWREEALAVYDAVEEVKGIRDEIVAARADIAGTLHTAQEDIDGALSGARLDVQQQVQNVTSAALPPATQATPPETKAPTDTSASTSEEKAIAKTQDIVGDLLEKRAQAEPPVPHRDAGTTARDTGPTAGEARSAEKELPRAPDSSPATHTPVRPADLAALRTRVTTLQDEMRALRRELAQYRARTWSQKVAAKAEERRQGKPSTASPADTAPADTAPTGTAPAGEPV
jgi:sec-independent protein translocase protein TatB